MKDIVLKSIDEKEMIELTKNVVAIPSVTGDETELAKFLANFMEKKGIEVELQEVEKGKFQTIGRIIGSGGGSSLMLCGHLDMFPPPMSMKEPYKAIIKENRVYGAAIGDMKAGDVAMVMAATALKKSGVKLKGDIVIALVLEEEIGGVGITHLLKKGTRADMGVVSESTNLEIATTGAGIAQFTVSTLGKSTHVSSKEHGIDSIEKMSKVINALKDLKFTYKPDSRVPLLPRFVAGTIIGGRGRDYDLRGSQNLSDYCTLIIDVRFWKSQTVETIEKDIRKLLDEIAANDPDFRYELKGVPTPFGNRAINRNPMDVPLDAPIIKIVQENHKNITGGPTTFRETFSTAANNDGCHMNEAGIPTITYGPGPGKKDLKFWGTLPTAEKWIDFNTVVTCSKVLSLTAIDVCMKEKNV